MRPAPSGSAIDALVAAVLAHEGEIFRQRREHRAEARRFSEKTAGRLEIGVDIVAGGHLDCRNAHAALSVQAHKERRRTARQIRQRGSSSQVPCHCTRRVSGASVQPRRATEPRSAFQARASRARAGEGTAVAASDTRS